MHEDVMPEAKIRRWEFVTVINSRMGGRWLGRRGTALWLDRPWQDRRSGAWSQWAYCIHFPDTDAYGSFLESDLHPTGEFDSEEVHRGRRFEISFDCVLDADSAAVEGSYRVPGRHWEIFFFQKEDVLVLRHEFGTWQSGITGVEFDVPGDAILGRDDMIRAMSAVFGAEGWVEVDGPYSLLLK
jgi:hypothetical protein